METSHKDSIEAGDFVDVIEHPGRKLAGVVSDVSGGVVKVTVSNGSNDWHETYVDRSITGEGRFPTIQLALDFGDDR